jgi:photosystem II stability/assembly factor-like uncharacterized protein
LFSLMNLYLKSKTIEEIMKTKLFIIVLTIITYASNINSQSGWQWQNPLPQGHALHDLDKSGNLLIAVGGNATILRSFDNGVSWIIDNLVNGEQSAFSSADLISDQKGWVVTGDRVLYTVDGGENWTTVNTGTFAAYESIFFIDENIGWVCGSSGKILKSTDGGTSWNEQISGVSQTTCFYEIIFLNSNLGWTAGEDGIILKTTDGGSVWTPQTSGTSTDLRSICFIDENIGWASGISGTIISTTDGGATWNSQTSGTTNALSKIIFLDSATGFSSGFNEVLKTADGGQTWNTIIENEEKWFISIGFFGNEGWTVGSNGLIMHSTDTGISWNTKSSGVTHFLKDIFLTENNELWAVGNSGTVLHSADRISWVKNDSVFTTKPLNQITFADANNGWAVGGFSAYIIHTSDGGITWDEQTTLPGWSLLTSVGFANIDTGWCVGLQGTIIYTTDSGQNWTAQTGNTNETLNDIYVFDALSAIIVGSDGTVLKTSDAGNTWNAKNSGSNSSLSEIFMLNDQLGWAVGDREVVGGDGTILMTSDGGETWSHQTGGLSFKTYTAVKFSDPNNGVVAATDGTIIRTNDGGTNWVMDVDPLNIPIADLEMTDVNNLWVVGENGAILKQVNGLTLIEDNSFTTIPEDFQLEQNYPNPFNPETTIRFTVPNNSVEASFAVLKIYDVLGNEAAVLVDGELFPGSHEVTFNAENLSSGVYIYRLQINGNSISKKMMFLK